MQSSSRSMRWIPAVLLAACTAAHVAVVPQTPVAPASTGVAADKGQTLFLASRDTSAILGFPATAHGNVAPTIEIAGSKTGLYLPVAFAVDAGSGRIYAANDSATSVLVFPKGANGNVTPQTLGGSNVPIESTAGIAIDAHGKIYVSDYKANAIYVFAAGATGNSVPIRTIAGRKTRLREPVGMAFDSSGHLYVANPYFFAKAPIVEFAADANGNVAPIGVIHGKHTQIARDFGNISIDKHDRIVVAYGQSILVFAAGAHGNIFPKAVIKGPATKIEDVFSVGTDDSSNIYASQYVGKTGKSSILVFGAGAHGDKAPLRVLAGSHTGIEIAHYPSFY